MVYEWCMSGGLILIIMEITSNPDTADKWHLWTSGSNNQALKIPTFFVVDCNTEPFMMCSTALSRVRHTAPTAAARLHFLVVSLGQFLPLRSWIIFQAQRTAHT